jgi:hypothetical protein
MEIQLFDKSEPLHFEQIVIYPYPDLKRLWVRMWLTAKLDQHPNVEVRVMNPDGSENNSMYLVTQTGQKIDNTLHLRNPVPGETYRVIAELTVGFGNDATVVDHREFDMTLEFRNPESGEPGFGFTAEEANLAGEEQADEEHV